MNVHDEVYLGDGLFASVEHGMIKLRAPRNHEDHVVYLDPGVLQSFEDWLARLRREANG